MTSRRSRDLRRVQVRTTAIALVTVVVILVAAAIALVTILDRGLIEQNDQRLHEIATIAQRADERGITIPTEAVNEVLVQLVNEQGDVLYASERLEGDPALWKPTADTPPDRPVTVTSPTLSRVRVMGVPYRDNWLVTIRTLESADESINTLIKVLLGGLPVVAIGVGIVIWFVVGRTLRPVDEAREREERLLADVSHELRNPLAGVRALLESESHDLDEIALNRMEALATLGRLEEISEGLLVVARSADAPVQTRPVDLDEIVQRVVDRMGRDGAPEIDLTAVRGGQVLGVESDLESMVENLLTNAVRHADAVVAVSVTEDHGEVELIVSDDGPGIPPEDRERVFDRFTRLDESRTRAGGGSGLGLSIVRAVVSAHHGRVVAQRSAQGGAAIVVTLPASLSS